LFVVCSCGPNSQSKGFTSPSQTKRLDFNSHCITPSDQQCVPVSTAAKHKGLSGLKCKFTTQYPGSASGSCRISKTQETHARMMPCQENLFPFSLFPVMQNPPFSTSSGCGGRPEHRRATRIGGGAKACNDEWPRWRHPQLAAYPEITAGRPPNQFIWGGGGLPPVKPP
jgi:hypothetical protein